MRAVIDLRQAVADGLLNDIMDELSAALEEAGAVGDVRSGE